jgi:hypothetical protein
LAVDGAGRGEHEGIDARPVHGAQHGHQRADVVVVVLARLPNGDADALVRRQVDHAEDLGLALDHAVETYAIPTIAGIDAE